MAFTLIANTFGIPLVVHGVAVTSDIDTTGADLLIAAIADSFWGSNVLTDSKSNTWIPLTAYSNADKSRIWLYYCVSPTVGSGHTFTVTPSGDNYPSVYIAAFSGVAASPYDTINGTTATNTSLATGSITPAENNELIITALCSESLGGPYTVDSGFIITDQVTFVNSLYLGGALAYKIQTTLAAINPIWTHNASNVLIVTVASFKASSVGIANARVTQEPIEILTGEPAARSTQNSLEVITGIPNARLSQESLEVLTGSPAAKVSQVAIEVLVNIVPIVTQVPVEVIVVNDNFIDDAETLYYRRYLQDVRRNPE